MAANLQIFQLPSLSCSASELAITSALYYTEKLSLKAPNTLQRQGTQKTGYHIGTVWLLPFSLYEYQSSRSTDLAAVFDFRYTTGGYIGVDTVNASVARVPGHSETHAHHRNRSCCKKNPSSTHEIEVLVHVRSRLYVLEGSIVAASCRAPVVVLSWSRCHTACPPETPGMSQRSVLFDLATF